MAINTLEYAILFQQALDEKLVAESKTSWMEKNASNVIYNGGNKYRVPKIEMDDITDYDRATGFAEGSVTLEYEEKTFDNDWGRTFSLDSMDVNETNYVATASNVMGEFVKTKVSPKVDSYRMKKISKLAIEAGNSRAYTVNKSSVYSEIKKDLNVVIGETGIAEESCKIHISQAAFEVLCESTELQKTLQVNGAAADLNSKVKTVNGAELIVMPNSRMKTEDGKAINWEIMVDTAPVAISKHEKIRQFTPDQNQKADAYKIDYRLYHTLNINDNQLDGVYVNVAEA